MAFAIMFKVHSLPHQSVFAITFWKLATQIIPLAKLFHQLAHGSARRRQTEHGQSRKQQRKHSGFPSQPFPQCAEPVLLDPYDSISPSVTYCCHKSLQSRQEGGLINSRRIFWGKKRTKKNPKICLLVANAIWRHSFFQMCWYLYN